MEQSPLASYLSLKDAAHHFGLAPRRLLSLGADGRIPVYAPVLNAGIYHWPTGVSAIAFPALPTPFPRHFNSADRVQLTLTHLKQIEGQGWSDVRSFYSVEAARQTLADAQFGPMLREKRWAVRTSPGLGKAGYQVQTLEKEDEYKPVDPELSDLAMASAWHFAEKTALASLCTTVRHLFVKPREVSLLIDGEGCEPAVHGNTIRNAEKREQVLAAALHVLFKHPARCKDARSLAQEIEAASAKFWPVSRVSPIELRSMEDLLQKALADGKIRGRS